jgi:hypothetical protein
MKPRDFTVFEATMHRGSTTRICTILKRKGRIKLEIPKSKGEKNMDNPKMLYHFTSRYHLPFILQSGYLDITESNYSFTKAGLYPVVWLTEDYEIDEVKNGLSFGEAGEVSKAEIRFSIPMQPHFERWSTWSRYTRKMKQIDWMTLVTSIGAGETHRQWWVSEKTIPLSEVAKIENTKTGEIFTADDRLPTDGIKIGNYNDITINSGFGRLLGAIKGGRR